MKRMDSMVDRLLACGWASERTKGRTMSATPQFGQNSCPRQIPISNISVNKYNLSRSVPEDIVSMYTVLNFERPLQRERKEMSSDTTVGESSVQGSVLVQ